MRVLAPWRVSGKIVVNGLGRTRRMNGGTLAAAMGMLVALPLGGCTFFECGSDRVAVYHIAGSSVLAQLNVKNCGATTGYTYELFVAHEGDDAEVALRFSGIANAGTWPRDLSTLVRLKASAPNAIQVQVTVPVDISKAERQLGDIRLSYTYPPGSNDRTRRK